MKKDIRGVNMSQTKKFKFQFIFILVLFSFFMFGCKNETPVEDICFNLENGEQIVLIVGQTFEIGDYVVVKPSYATNKSYTITSYNEDVVKVENNKLIALKEDSAVIKVTSNDNPLKESMMTVIVKASQEQLSAPLNLKYDHLTQSFSFDPVLYASSYTLKINGEEIELGNSHVFGMSQCSASPFDRLLVVQVKANAPTYSFALKTSEYSKETKIYQAGAVSDLKIEGGIVKFAKSSSGNAHNVYLNNTIIEQNIDGTTASLTSLNQIYAGQSVKCEVEAVVKQEIKQQYGADVLYYSSVKQSINLNVLGVPTLRMSASKITWNNLPHATRYSIFIDGEKVGEANQNYFDLQSLAEFDDVITSKVAHEVKVVPVLENDSVGIGQTTKESVIKVQRLSQLTVSCDGSDIIWNTVENASVYAISLTGEDVNLNSSTALSKFSMKNHVAGDYVFKITAIASEEPNSDGVYFLSSETVEKIFSKHKALNVTNDNIKDYVLDLTILNEDKCEIRIDDETTAYETLLKDNKLYLTDITFVAGPHEIFLKRLGDDNHIESDVSSIKFTQLEKIEDISISNYVVSVSRSDTNKKATIKLVTSGSQIEDIVVAQTSYIYNSEHEGRDCLPAGNDYVTKVYVEGDGSSTFSYRENGEVVACCEVKFEVLSAPANFAVDKETATLTFDNISNNYKLFTIGGTTKDLTTNTCDIDLSKGSASFQVQAIGDGKKTLNSILSKAFTVTRLEQPTLKYNNINNFISMVDTNASGVAGYKFTHNGKLISDYNFGKEAFKLEDDTIGNVFTLTAVAVDGKDNIFYLNSTPYKLTLNQINNSATISLSGLENNLIIQPTGRSEQYNLVVEFTLNDGSQTYVSTFTTKLDEATGNQVLSNNLEGENEIVLPYSYNGGYVIQLIDENHNAIIEDTNNEFSVRVRYIKQSTGNDVLINSEFSESTTLNLNRIDGTTEISVNTNNQIVLTTNHTREFGLVGVVMLRSTFGYIVESNGEGQLVCNKYILNGEEQTIAEPIGLSYTYVYNSLESKSYYYINVLDENHELIIPGIDSSFTAQVKYSFAHNGVGTDLDSEYSKEKTITIQPVAEISRDGQNIKIKNVKETYTYLDYSLLINNYPLSLDDSAVSLDSYIVFDVEYIYNNTPSDILQEVNKVEVVVKNVETSTDSPILSTKGGNISIKKTETVVLSSYKYNNNEDGAENNSVVINFEKYVTSYDKKYIVEIYNGGQKVYDKHYEDVQEGVISFNLDEIEQLSSVSGMLNIVAYVQTSGVENSVNVFNSVQSNELHISKLEAPVGLFVTNSTLSFNAVPNAVGYEIYLKTGVGYTKINEQLITTNSYNISNMTGKNEIVVKAISQVNGYSNSSYSEVITINKVAKPVVNVVNGKFNIEFSLDIISLLANSSIKIIPEISNGSTENVTIDLKNLDGEELKLNLLTLEAEPYLFMAYNNQTLTAETLTLTIKIEQTEAIDGVYYLNSDAVVMNCHGLFAPSNVKKTTNENNSVEMLSWTASDKNVLNGASLSVGYIFKVEYVNGDDSYVYYSDDAKLKYYSSSTATYESYSSFIASTSAIFPAGYDSDNDGTLDVKFGAGKYKVSVQSVPLSTISGYNLCSSFYTSACEFEILPAAELAVAQGKVLWNAQDKADHYIVSIYEQGATEPLLVDTTTIAEYDFSNKNLDSLTGVYKVVVKTISTKDDTLNSAESVPLFVYRLPQASEVSIDDGHLILSATNFFTKAEIELVDTTNNSSFIVTMDNEANSEKHLNDLMKNANISEWFNFTNVDTINEINKFAISIDNEVLKISDGSDYTINVKLIGNNNSSLGFISSVKSTNLSNMTATKLKPNLMNVNLGVVQFMPDEEYATISSTGVYKSLVALNYAFNGVTSISTFWNSTVVYKIVVTTATDSSPIYAVDYYSFKTAIDNGDIEASDYELLSGAYGLYARLKYSYVENSETKTLSFNVYENNMINLRDYNALYYYSLTEIMENGVNKFVGGTTYSTIDLTSGGSFAVEVFMLGGDSYSSSGKVVGTLSAQAKETKTFVRYGVNQLSTKDGKVQFNSLIQTSNGVAIDHPIYKLVVTPLNGDESEVFYIYHTTETDAKEIAKRHDAENFENATYLQTVIDELSSTIIFDMSEYFPAGTYKVSIRTLAGLGSGSGDEQDYLLNALVPSVEYTFQKLTDSKFVANNGILEFAQSYIVRDGSNIYYDNYEITLIDNLTNQDYVFNINRNSEGVTFDDSYHTVRYVLPETMLFASGLIVIDGGKEYSIKVRAIATDNYILNGTYKVENNEEVLFTFEKSLGLSETINNQLRIENGILKWKVLDMENFVNTVIKVTFLDENLQTKTILINVDNANKVEVDGIYQYHYYQFSDDKYNLQTVGSAYILDKIAYNLENGSQEERSVIYTITAYTAGKTVGERNILNSNPSTEITTTRLSAVAKSSIKTLDGLLTWEAIENASSYEVILVGDEKHMFTTTKTSINFLEDDKMLDVGTYSVQIKALGSNIITAMNTMSDTQFVQLDVVNIDSVKIEGDKIVWDAVENSDAYKVVFEYTDLFGTAQTLTEEVYETSFSAPSGISGTFTINISAISKGEGSEFNGKTVSYTSSTEAPMQVTNFEFDSENNRFIIDLNKATSFNGDELLIVYNFTEYLSDGLASTVSVNNSITYKQYGYYFELDSTTDRYYYPITVMGQYSQISVQVVRPGTLPSNTVQIPDIDLHLFAYGAGTAENQYRISTAEQLLNIGYFTSAHYLLTDSISMKDVDVANRLSSVGAIISENFNGVLDGGYNTIAGFNVNQDAKTDTISLNGTTNFALFKTLNDATIKNLVVGSKENQLILSNMFANNVANVINLSLIATGANNSIIDNVDVFNLKIQLGGSSATISDKVYIAGLINQATDSEIANSTVNIAVEINVGFTNDMYVGGVVSIADNSDLKNSTIEFNLSSSVDNAMSFVGGAIAYYTGNEAKTTGISDTTANITIANVKTRRFGGLVGYATYINIQNSSTEGTYTKTNTAINYNLSIGGIAGIAQSSTIENSGSTVTFDLAINSTTNKYVGAIAGELTTVEGTYGVLGVVNNCYMNSSYKDQTNLGTSPISLGIYGYIEETAVSVKDCYSLQN